MNELELNIEKALDLIKGGDSKGLDLLYEYVSKQMLFVATNYLKSDDLAQDAVQNSFIDIVKNIKSYKKNNGYGWIMMITKNNSINLLKKENKFISYNDDIFFNNDDECMNLENYLMVKKLLNSLYPPIVKNMIFMKYFMNMTVREIAKELKVSKSYVSKEIIKAENSMRNLITSGQISK